MGAAVSLWLLNPPAGPVGSVKVNPLLAVYGPNPGKRRRKKTMARRGRDARGRFLKRGASKARGRSKRRRNPGLFPVSANPRRRRSVSRRSTRRRNPARRGGGGFRMGRIMSFVPPMGTIAAGVAGAAATRMIPGYAARFLPQIPTTGPGGLVTRAAAAALAGMVTAMFAGQKRGQDVALGGFITVADEAFRTYAAPAMGLSAYLEPAGMGAYLTPGGMASYIGPGATVPGVGEELSQYLDDDDLSGDVPSRLDVGSRL